MSDHIRDLDGKVAIVTGAGYDGSIGSISAQVLAQAGARVVLADLPGTKLSEITDALTAEGLQVVYQTVDISDEDSVKALIKFVLDTYGRLDIVVNNAGIIGHPGDRDVLSMSVEVWDQVMGVNARGTMLMCKHSLPALMAGGGGSIINISSAASLAGDFAPTAYACSKGAINTLTRYVATQFATKGVRCNALALSLVLTSKFQAQLPPAFQEIYVQQHLSGRLGKPTDVAEMILFLASDRSTWITGQVISVDGGFFAHFPTTAGMAELRNKMVGK